MMLHRESGKETTTGSTLLQQQDPGLILLLLKLINSSLTAQILFSFVAIHILHTF
jgi:hypothetical protein